MKTKFFLMWLLLLLLNAFSYSHQVKVKDIEVVNYTNFSPLVPEFFIDITFEELPSNIFEGLSPENVYHHDHVHIIVEAVIEKSIEQFVIGETAPFTWVSDKRIRVFLPQFSFLSENKNYSLLVNILLEREIGSVPEKIFSKSFSFTASSKVFTLPYFLTNNQFPLIISKRKPLPKRIYYISTLPFKGVIEKNGKSVKINSQKAFESFDNLCYVEYNFQEDGKYKLIFQNINVSIDFDVVYDSIPPKFSIVLPESKKTFFRSNIVFIWETPLDDSGVDVEKSYLSITSKQGVKITNIRPLIPLNKMSVSSPFQYFFTSLSPGEYTFLVEYSDFDGNKSSKSVEFSVSTSEGDKVSPFLPEVQVYSSVRRENNIIVFSTNLRLLVNVKDDIYGSGVDRVSFNIANRREEVKVFGETFEHVINLASKTSKETLVVESFDKKGNKSPTLRLNLSFSNLQNDEFEDNNDITQSKQIDPGKELRLVLPEGDVDFFKFSGDKLAILKVNYELNTGANMLVELKDGRGNTIESFYPSDGESLKLKLPYKGRYFLKFSSPTPTVAKISLSI